MGLVQWLKPNGSLAYARTNESGELIINIKNFRPVAMADNYSALPTPASNYNLQIWSVKNSQWTQWLPWSLGWTYYPKWLYQSIDWVWEYRGEFPYNATQQEVDDWLDYTKFVSPWTLANTTVQWAKYLPVEAKNTTGSTVQVGTVVYIEDSQGSMATIAIADKDSEATSSKTVWLLAKTTENNGTVALITKGKYKFNGLDTSAFTEWTQLWLGDNGGLLQSPPAEPAHAVYIGILEIKGTNSTIIVDIQNGYELNELHGVQIANEQDGEVLQYEASTGLWKNKSQETFETVSKNLKSYPSALNYTTETLTSIVYTLPTGTITKTLNYTSGKLTSIVLSGSTPSGISLTKTLGYTGENLSSISYS